MKSVLFLSLLAFTALTFSGCNEVVENTTTEPIPVNMQESNLTHAQDNIFVVEENSDSNLSDSIVENILITTPEVNNDNPSSNEELSETTASLPNQVVDIENDEENIVQVKETEGSTTESSTTEAEIVDSGENSDNCSDNTEAEIIGAAASLNDSSDLSASLLRTSQNLLLLSNSMMQAGTFANVEYISSMYSLSQDILTMANRIGEMSDRILIMSDKIGDMSDRIVVTQNLQNENVALTQKNILEVQENFSYLLKLR